MTACAGLTGRVFGHHYEPRFSVAERARGVKIGNLEDVSADELRDLITLRDRTYHGDVCTRCGHSISPSSPSHTP